MAFDVMGMEFSTPLRLWRVVEHSGGRIRASGCQRSNVEDVVENGEYDDEE